MAVVVREDQIEVRSHWTSEEIIFEIMFETAHEIGMTFTVVFAAAIASNISLCHAEKGAAEHQRQGESSQHHQKQTNKDTCAWHKWAQCQQGAIEFWRMKSGSQLQLLP